MEGNITHINTGLHNVCWWDFFQVVIKIERLYFQQKTFPKSTRSLSFDGKSRCAEAFFYGTDVIIYIFVYIISVLRSAYLHFLVPQKYSMFSIHIVKCFLAHVYIEYQQEEEGIHTKWKKKLPLSLWCFFVYNTYLFRFSKKKENHGYICEGTQVIIYA